MTFHEFMMPLLMAGAEIAQGATTIEIQKELGVVSGQIPAAFWTVWLLQKLKDSTKVPYLNEYSERLNRLVGVVVAFLASAGLNFAVQGSLLSGGTVTITFPALGQLLHFLLFDVARSYGMQQGFFKLLTRTTAK